MNIREDVVEAVRHPTFTFCRNKHAAGPRYRMYGMSAEATARWHQEREPVTEITCTRYSDPVILERWP